MRPKPVDGCILKCYMKFIFYRQYILLNFLYTNLFVSSSTSVEDGRLSLQELSQLDYRYCIVDSCIQEVTTQRLWLLVVHYAPSW
jgi:hypothetical protein